MINTKINTDKFLDTIERLSLLLKSENDILAGQSRANQIKSLQEDKIKLTNSYEEQFKIIGSSEFLKKIEPELLENIETAVVSLNGLIEENANRLRARLDAGEHLFRIISEAAIDHQNKTSGYSKLGSSNRETRQAYQAPVSVGLNQEL